MLTLSILLAIYFLPTIIAAARGHNALAVFLLNFLLGWTFFGWLFALIWSVTDKPRVEYVVLPVRAGA